MAFVRSLGKKQESELRCPECIGGKKILETIPYYSTEYNGTPIVIKDAQISKCAECGKVSISSAETKRWKTVAYCVEKWKDLYEEASNIL